MTGTVVFLASHRRNHSPAVTCKACRPDSGWVCYPHQLAALADRVRAAHEALDPDVLLVSRAEVDRLTSDVLAVIQRVTADYLDDERTAR